ncbi:unnamed protein product (mitochondrion) [Plasmodiophora brassicae]|uniref:Uncharacterized protein n=1 Tax=Plasmodiophora brassicae TaxID=37360 RepID=A0A0G4IXT8_PLABS|nr:hypothetical protein PBRA_007693 [Plasmodiophora brassicae]SPQ99590.1 unnamed protein product [Plasmodiophora brassicae]
MQFSITSQIQDALRERHQSLSSLRTQIRAVYGRRDARRGKVARDVTAAFSPSAALLTILSPGASIVNIAGTGAAGIARQGVIKGAAKIAPVVGNEITPMATSGILKALSTNTIPWAVVGNAAPLGVYMCSFMAIKKVLRLEEKRHDSGLDMAGATAAACLIAGWSWPIAFASAVQVVVYSSMARADAASADLDEVLEFNTRAGLTAGLASGASFLIADRAIAPRFRPAVGMGGSGMAGIKRGFLAMPFVAMATYAAVNGLSLSS